MRERSSKGFNAASGSSSGRVCASAASGSYTAGNSSGGDGKQAVAYAAGYASGTSQAVG